MSFEISEDKKGFLSSKSLQSGSSGPLNISKRKSWGQKLEESFYLAIIGTFLFIFSFPMLWYNERRLIETNRILKEGFAITKEVNSATVDKENEGKLVFTTGHTKTDSPLKDEEVNITFDDVIKVHRKVQMYQVQENRSESSQRDTFGGGETTNVNITYTNVWSSSIIDSSSFNDPHYRGSNPSGPWIIDSHWFKAPVVHLGGFQLSDEQIDMIMEGESCSIENFNVAKVSDKFKAKIGSGILGTSKREIFIRFKDPNIDHIGDIKFCYSLYRNKDLSLISEQKGNSFVGYDIGKKGLGKIPKNRNNEDEEGLELQLDDGCSCGNCCFCCKVAGNLADKLCQAPSKIDWVYEKTVTKKGAFQIQADLNSGMTWGFRFLGAFTMWLGVFLFFSPLFEILQALPLLSPLGKFLVAVLALAVCIPTSILVIAMAWFFYRPIYAIFLILIISPFVYYFVVLAKEAELSGLKA